MSQNVSTQSVMTAPDGAVPWWAPGVVLLVLGELYTLTLRSRRAREEATDFTPSAPSPSAG